MSDMQELVGLTEIYLQPDKLKHIGHSKTKVQLLRSK
jgi:hypothetical protein